MRTDLLDRYVLLYARPRNGGIEFDYADEHGNEIECGAEGRVEGKTAVGISGFFSERVGSVLAEALAAMPMQFGPHGIGVVPLAVFVGTEEPVDSLPPSYGLADIGVEALSNAFGVDGDRLQAVVLPRRDWPFREPFTLPLRVGATSAATYDALQETESRPWYLDDPFVRNFGLKFEAMHHPDVKADWPDVVFIDSPVVLRQLAKMPYASRPRLIVSSGFFPEPDDPVLEASSCLVLHADPPALFVKELIYALIHDQPLHEMVKSAQRHVPFPAHLIADPASVEHLRMLQAMEELANEAEEIEASGHVVAPEGDEESTTVLRLDFGREMDALVPMSRVRAAVLRAREAIRDRWASKSSIPNAPRYVDVTLLRTDARSGEPLYVRGDSALSAGARYRVKVRIGVRSTVSLVIGDIPPIDTLLPPPTGTEGHLLHVVCYPLDFQPVTATIRRVVLPLEGASKAVSFDVVAPKTPGPARLRIAVYYDADLSIDSIDEADAYRNHLIQSFVLQTTVDTYDHYSAEATSVTLEFSRTASFSRLDQYTARVASFAVNAGPDGTHQLMMKRAGMHRSFSLNPLLLQNAVADVRQKLFDATALDEEARFPRFLDGAPNEQAFDDAIRSLAKAGAAMRQKIFADPSTDTSKLLTAVAGTVDEIVQVVRFDTDFYFPWHVLYDYEPPDEIFGGPQPPVCKEFRRTNSDGTPLTATQCLEKCAHPGKNDAFCVYGFWGARLQVEQTLHRPNTADEPIRELDVREKGVLVVSDLHANAAKDLAAKLTAEMDAKLVEELQAPPDLLTKLWSSERPSIIVILGHYQTKPVVGEVNEPRVRVPGGWLIADKILRKIEKSGDEWDKPHPVVIMAACDSAGEDLLTMNGFVTAFAKARAGAFLGTETTVFEPLARDFALAITKALVDHQTLGAALLDFRRGLLQQLNPLGFVFSGYGDAELVWPPAKGTA